MPAILLLMLLKALRKLPLWCLPHHLSPAADKGGAFPITLQAWLQGFPPAGGIYTYRRQRRRYHNPQAKGLEALSPFGPQGPSNLGAEGSVNPLAYGITAIIL